MNDLAVLGLEVRSDGVVVASDRMRRFEGDSGRAERSASALTRGIGRLVAQFVALAAVSFSFRSMISGAREFNAAIAEVSTLLPVVEGEIDAITEASRRMSREFGGSAAAQARAFYQAISAGAGDAAQATELLEIANRTAIGGVTEVTTAVDVLTTATNAFAAQNLEAADAADILFVGMRQGKTTIGELAGQLGQAIPTASALGLGFEELVAATAALTTQGQNTAMAVTGINAALAAIISPSKQATDLAKELGLEFNAAALQAQGLAGFMEEVVDATGGSEEALSTLFGSIRGLRAVFSLAGEGGRQFNTILGQMEDRAGAADEAFNRVSDSLDQRLNVAMAKISDAALGMGGALLEYVVPGVEGAAVAVQFLADNADTAMNIIVPFTAALGTYAIAAGGAAAATGLLTAALAVLTGPAGLLALAVGGIVALYMAMGDTVSPAEAAADAIAEVDKALADVEAQTPSHLEAMGKEIQAHLDLAKSALAAAMAEREYLRAKEETTFYLGGLGADALDESIRRNNDELDRLMDLIAELENRAGALNIAGTFAALGGAQTFDSVEDMWGALGGGPDSGRRGGGRGGGRSRSGSGGAQLNAFEQMRKAIQESTVALGDQAVAFGLTEEAAVRFTTAMELLRAAEEAKLPITAELIEEINGLADAYALAQEQARQYEAAAQLLNTVETPFQQMQDELAGLNAMLERGVISWQQYGDAAARSMMSAAQATASAVGQQLGMLSQAFEGNRALAYATAVVKGIEAVVSSYAAGARIGGPLVGAAFAATAAAATGAQIAAIGRTSLGSARAPSVSGGGSAPAINNQAQQPAEQRVMNITLAGRSFSRDDIRDLVEAMNDEMGDGVILRVNGAAA